MNSCGRYYWKRNSWTNSNCGNGFQHRPIATRSQQAAISIKWFFDQSVRRVVFYAPHRFKAFIEFFKEINQQTSPNADYNLMMRLIVMWFFFLVNLAWRFIEHDLHCVDSKKKTGFHWGVISVDASIEDTPFRCKSLLIMAAMHSQASLS